MRKCIDLTGQRFGRLTVIERSGSTKHGAAKWRCMCECGKETIVIGDELRKGNTTSCGCYAREVSRELALEYIAGQNKTHDMTETPIYKEWSEMKRRCYNPQDTSYENYGGRGIAVCDKWRDSFEAFYEDVSKLPHFGEKGYSLNRKDNDGNYEPNNIEWATAKEQANNRRSNHLIAYNGKTQTIAQWAEEYKMPYKKLWKRLNTFHWDIARALNTP